MAEKKLNKKKGHWVKVREYPKEEDFVGIADGLSIMQVEKYGDGFIIADHRQEGTVMYRGKSDNWIEGSPVVEDPFAFKEEAQEVLDNKNVSPISTGRGLWANCFGNIRKKIKGK